MIGDLPTPLSGFREAVAAKMGHPKDRPFLCNGDPLGCRVFLVGFNPATSLPNDFWSYWSDVSGFDLPAMMSDYSSVRKLRGVRPRLRAIVDQMPPLSCLETNICSTPTRTAAALNQNMRTTEIFEYLYDAIKPALIFAHSNRPIQFFADRTGNKLEGLQHTVEWRGHKFVLVTRPGPLWRCSIDEAAALGSELAKLLN